MSSVQVPQIGSWWDNPNQPGQRVQVVNLVLRKHDPLVIFQWGLRPEDVGAMTVERFYATFTERPA